MAVKSLIETVTVGAGGAASIEFTAIPQDGSDLVVKISTRSDGTGLGQKMLVRFNGDSSTNYDWIYLRGNGSTAFTSSASSDTDGQVGYQSGTGQAANIFGSGDLYISNYTSTANKTMSTDFVNEGEAGNMFQLISAHSYTTSSAITSVLVFPEQDSFVQYSTASLYKIKYD